VEFHPPASHVDLPNFHTHLSIPVYLFFILVVSSVFLILLSPLESYIESILIHVCLQFNLNLQVTTRWQQVYSYQTM
jgi:hypothetical protein